MRPIIGILPATNEADGAATKSSLVNYGYTKAIENAGGTPILLPVAERDVTLDDFVELCDGFLFAGGEDIEPWRYGEEASPHLGRTAPERDRMEFRAFDKIIKTDKPVMGICRGSQLINVALGGSLYQDLPSEYENALKHKQEHPHASPAHSIIIESGTPLAALAGTETVQINSLHHQAVKKLGQGLSAMAHAEDGIIEASYLVGDRYLMLFQWHPERMLPDSALSKAIFDDFIAHAIK